MKLKIAKVGQSSLVVSLPFKWVKEYNLKKGDEVDVISEGKILKIITDKAITENKIIIDVSELDTTLVWRFVLSCYKRGFKEIKVAFDSPNIKAGGRYERRGKVQDGMADLSSYMVIGGKVTSIQNLDLRHIGAIVEKNGEIVSTGTGAAALGNPVHVLVWLINKISTFGLKLLPGMFVITGSIVPIVQIEVGDKCKATFDRLGSVSANFV